LYKYSTYCSAQFKFNTDRRSKKSEPISAPNKGFFRDSHRTHRFTLRRLELPSPYDSSSSDFSSLPPNSIPPLFALSLYFYTSQLYHTIDTAVQPGRKLTIWPACFWAIILACFFRPLQAPLLAYQSPLLLEAEQTSAPPISYALSFAVPASAGLSFRCSLFFTRRSFSPIFNLGRFPVPALPCSRPPIPALSNMLLNGGAPPRDCSVV
jgi:hypothetical protein